MRDTKREIVIKNLHKLLLLVKGYPEYEDCISYAIEELEQEPILDKIREEIKEMTSNRGFLSCSVEYIHEEIDNVFDKYKAENESQESEE